MNPRVIISPHSNNRTRDWPRDHVRQLAILCVERLDAVVEFVGSKEQRHSVNKMIRALPADRYRNRCGLLSWKQTGALMQTATCVISNNSGIGHYAAALDVPVICVFAATHSPFEWMPRGPHVSVVIRQTACSLCLIVNSVADCPHDLRCLTDIAPSEVFEEVRRLIARPRRSADAPSEQVCVSSAL